MAKKKLFSPVHSRSLLPLLVNDQDIYFLYATREMKDSGMEGTLAYRSRLQDLERNKKKTFCA